MVSIFRLPLNISHSKQFGKTVIQAIRIEFPNLSEAIRQKIGLGKLTVLLQNSQDSADSSDELGAPAAAVYKGQSGGIIATMQDLYDKGEAQLAEARKKETQNVQAFEMLAQSLKDEIC